MNTCFDILGGRLVSTMSDDAKIRIMTPENEKEKEQVTQIMGINSYDIDAALDPDEISRIEFNPNLISIIWKRPYRTSAEDFDFGVASTGLFLRGDQLSIIISKENLKLFSKEELKHVNSIMDVLLKYFFYTIRKYLQHLKEIKKATSELELKISSSLENKAFLQMFQVSESLIYYLNAIEANGNVLIKLREHVGKMKGLSFSMKQVEFLDDIILENRQCARQAQIYSTVLSGLMDARGNVINNNMNVLLKNLTLINVIFLPLNLIASMGGMSEFTLAMEKHHIDWRIGYVVFTLAMFVISLILWYILKRFINKWGGGR